MAHVFLFNIMLDRGLTLTMEDINILLGEILWSLNIT